MEKIGEAITILINEAMKAERSSVLNAQPWARTEGRCGYANGFTAKSVVSRIGKLNLNAPKFKEEWRFVHLPWRKEFEARDP